SCERNRIKMLRPTIAAASPATSFIREACTRAPKNPAVAPAPVEAETPRAVSPAAVEIVTASPAGAAWTALAEMTTASPLALAVSFTADDINRGAASNLIEPCGQNCARSQLVRVLRQVAENGLRYLFGQLRRPDLPQGRRIDQVQVPLNQCGKSLFGVPARVF